MKGSFQNHASVLVDHCLRVEQGDDVVIEAPPVAEPLVVALADVLGERGASMVVTMQSNRIRGTYLEASGPGSVPEPTPIVAAIEDADGFIAVQGAQNTAELAGTPSETKAAYTEATAPVRQAYIETGWVVTQYPAPGDAQAAKMSTGAYREFIADAVALDWDEQRKFQQPLADRLDEASEVRIRSNGTDVTFSVEGMSANNGDARKNLPGSEVATAPVPDSAEGKVLFDVPILVQGTVVVNARLSFSEGEVIELSAQKGEEVLESVISTDAGSSRLGEFGIGMNRSIDRPTRNVLLDEKMGDTVHLALGQSLPGTVGPSTEENESAVHEDLLVDMRETGSIELDGDIVYEDGVFSWEDPTRA